MMAGGMQITWAKCPRCGKEDAYASTDTNYPCERCKRKILREIQLARIGVHSVSIKSSETGEDRCGQKGTLP